MNSMENNNNPHSNGDFTSSALNNLLATFTDMLWLLKKNFSKVFLTIIACMAIFLSYAIVKYEPLYRTSVTFSITPLVLSDSQDGVSVYKFNYVFSFAEQMNRTFPHIIESDILRNSIMYDIGKPMNGRIISEPVYGSNVFKVIVESPSPEDADSIMNSFIKCYPTVAEHIIGDIRISVIHKEGMPNEPYNSRNYVIFAALGIIVGLFLCMVVFFIVALRRETIKDKNDIATKLNSNYICEIPHVSKKRTSNNKDALLKISTKTPGFSEAMRVLKKRVKSLLLENEKIIAITSTSGNEGKTTISYNLAHTFADGEDRTLLIDMDLIHRSLQNKLLKDPKKCLGLSDVTLKRIGLDKAICNVSKNFDILFAGSSNCKFNNKNIPDIIEKLRQEYDYIIVDMPPCGIVSDTALIANLCDGILFTVKCDNTAVSKIKKALQYILYSRARLLGFVINDRGSVTGGYGGKTYYSHYKRYGYRYHYMSHYQDGYGIDAVKPEK